MNIASEIQTILDTVTKKYKTRIRELSDKKRKLTSDIDTKISREKAEKILEQLKNSSI